LTVEEAEPGAADSHSQRADSHGSQQTGAASTGWSTAKDNCTAFVSNLDFAVTADQIREVFCKVVYSVAYSGI